VKEPPKKSLKARALMYLSKREYARQELFDKLRPYATEVEELNEILNDLETKNWLSNQRFAEQFGRQKSNKLGNRALMYQLKQKGVADTTASFVVENLETELNRAQKLMDKKLHLWFSTAPTDRIKLKQKWMAYLSRHGFSSSTIGQLFKTLALSQDTDTEIHSTHFDEN
jgi:regulatory protein